MEDADVIAPEPWWKLGACLNVNPAVFLSDAARTQAKAKAICATCPANIKRACLGDAIATGADGIRAGLTEDERRRPSTLAPVQVEVRTKLPPKSEHGTEARAKRHRRDGENLKIVCPECAEAETEAQRRRKIDRRLNRQIAQRARQHEAVTIADDAAWA